MSRRISRHVLAVAAGLLALAAATPAHAEVTAWFFAGGGALGYKNATTDTELGMSPALSFDVGAGTHPDAALVFGGMFKIMPLFDEGVDLMFQARGAMRSFQAGDFGIAVDAGAVARTWADSPWGFAGAVVLGAPLGLQVSLIGSYGQEESLTFGAIAGIDLLRLTIYRQTLLDYWTNPSPAHEARRETAALRR